MKSAKQHVVPLSTAALAVLDRQQRVRSGDAVFPGRSGSSLSYASFATAPAKAGINACTPHGWRSCFRDWCNDIGDVPRDLAEAALAHSFNDTEGAYRRMKAVERGLTKAAVSPIGCDEARFRVFPALDVFYRALKASEGIAGLSAAMRGLIAARIRCIRGPPRPAAR
jgi:hypothetical protein